MVWKKSADPTKDDEGEQGCLLSLFQLAAIGIHCLYPAFWCMTFFLDNYTYPVWWSVILCWLLGVVVGTIVLGNVENNHVINLSLWSMIIIETTVIYFINYM